MLSRADAAFSHRDVGATADPASLAARAHGYDLDRNRFALGTGRELFEGACTALLAWRHFEIPWVELHGAEGRATSGQVVATLMHTFGLWFLNPCRVVYTEHAPEASDHVAFAYGTLPGHVESGEERFAIRLDPGTGEVCYEVTAFSRPAVWLTKLGYPWVRRLQHRFVAASAAALARACGTEVVSTDART